MGLRVHLGDHALDLPRRIDDEGGAVHAIVGPAHKFLRSPHPVGLHDAVVFVGDERHRQPVLLDEFLVFGRSVRTHAQQRKTLLFQFLVLIAQATGGRRTARGIILGIEKQHQPLARKSGQGGGGPILEGAGKIRCWVAGLQCSHTYPNKHPHTGFRRAKAVAMPTRTLLFGIAVIILAVLIYRPILRIAREDMTVRKRAGYSNSYVYAILLFPILGPLVYLLLRRLLLPQA